MGFLAFINVMLCKFLKSVVDARLVFAGLAYGCLEVVGHNGFGHAAIQGNKKMSLSALNFYK
jgi:hypothetical protein